MLKEANPSPRPSPSGREGVGHGLQVRPDGGLLPYSLFCVRCSLSPAPASVRRSSESVSRVLSRMIIYLVRALPRGSCGSTREVGGQLQPSPIRPCSRRGLPSLRLATELVVSYTTVSALLVPATETGDFFSVALSLSPKGHPEVIGTPCPAEPGLSSPISQGDHPTRSITGPC